MRNRNEILADLKMHSVRISNSIGTIGTGFLIVPSSGENAYILTAAHLFKTEEYPLTVQCYVGAANGDEKQGCIQIQKDDVILHPDYDMEKEEYELQSQDTALICVEKEIGWKDAEKYSGEFRRKECQ